MLVFCKQHFSKVNLILSLLFLGILLTGQSAIGQSVERAVYSVFSPISSNDTVLVAAGQIMAGQSVSPTIEHGYYPLNHSLLSLEEESNDNNYQVFPNPFSEVFTIEFENINKTEVIIEVFSMNGQLIQRVKTAKETIRIDLNHNASGIYYVKGYSQNEVLFNHKISKS